MTRSGFEGRLYEQVLSRLGEVDYEKVHLEYVSHHTYTTDFELPNGIIVEGKGRFLSEDRTKHINVKAQHPDRDIRFVFMNSNTKLTTKGKSTYADWCRKHGFKFADKAIPESWFTEPPRKRR